MKEGTKEKLKFKKLKHRLKLPEYQVVGILESIWMLARSSAQGGDIGKHSNADIAVHIEWHGDEDELIAALVDCDWLIEDEDYRLVIKNWKRHVPNYLKGSNARHDKPFVEDLIAARNNLPPVAPPEDERPADEVRDSVLRRDGRICQYCGGDADTIDHVVSKHRGGNHEATNLVASCSGCNEAKGTLSVADFAKKPFCPEYLLLGIKNGTSNPLLGGVPQSKAKQSQANKSNDKPPDDHARVVEIANRLLRQRRIERSLTAEEVWRVAWVAADLDESVVDTIVSKFEAGQVRKAQNYVFGVMRGACEDHGTTWAKMLRRVGPMPDFKQVGGEA